MQYRPHRYPTEFPIDVRTPFGPQRARVMDVNATGAAIRGIEGLERGNKVFLNLLSQNIEGVLSSVRRFQTTSLIRYAIAATAAGLSARAASATAKWRCARASALAI